MATERLRTELVRMPAVDYHNDPVPPSLSASIAGVLNRQSPLHAWSQHPRLGGRPRQDTKSLDRGTLIHALLLGHGLIGIVDAPDWKTKAAREKRDEVRAGGAVPVLRREYDAAKATADILRRRFADVGVKLDGDSEVTALWVEHSEDGSAVQCRGRFDHLDGACIYDLKSCRSAHPDACRKHVDGFGYDIQHAAYVSALEHIQPILAGRVTFEFLFFELEEPFAVTPVRLSGAFRELGERRWRRAVSTWARCLRERHWPGYVEGAISLEPPPWALMNDMERALGEEAAE